MRHLFLYHIYSGEMFFSAVALFVLVAALDLSRVLDDLPKSRRVAGFAAVLAIALAALSGTPMPLVEAGVVFAAAAAYALRGFGARSVVRNALGATALAAALVAGVLELRWQLPSRESIRANRIVVIGDSLSSGGFGEQEPWPEVLGRILAVPVENLAMPSETAASAVRNQVPLLPPTARGDLVIVAIGGNDMIEGASAAEFSRALDRILASSAGGERNVLLVELPLLPGKWAYGAAQRRLTTRHGAVLLPKRILARVLLQPGNTDDGIHLRQPGHEALARELARLMTMNPGR